MPEKSIHSGDPRICIATLYKFAALPDYQSLRGPVLARMQKCRIYGTLLLAEEGVNGTLAGAAHSLDGFLVWLEQRLGIGALETRFSWAHKRPFKRCKVKLKKEIVTMGMQGIDPAKSAGAHVEPRHWNALIGDPDTLLIDARNEYEIAVGQFAGAVNPHTANFREFPEYAQKNLHPAVHKNIAMYCTGGIRCEKSTALLKSRGFENVYHLQGGILKYLEEIPPNESLWQGECFVFDERVTVDHDLNRGSYEQCHACRFPLSAEHLQSEQYVPGVSCPLCFDNRSAEDRARYAEREKQVRLARARGEQHIGPGQATTRKPYSLSPDSGSDLIANDQE